MGSTKISLSLSDEDLAFLETEALTGRYASRSAAIQDAVRLLRESRLTDAYAEALAEGYDDDWDLATNDGIASA
ncbi:ribbon-helix-helix domain-containing protein [Microbacterium sp.]|uniref:ribbon-helix-helix domain-containing protein n=1 Tax=Microbacterium sp. TaxID=51671 RepID=UPI003F976251